MRTFVHGNKMTGMKIEKVMRIFRFRVWEQMNYKNQNYAINKDHPTAHIFDSELVSM